MCLEQVSEPHCLGRSTVLDQKQDYLSALILLLDLINVAMIKMLSPTLPLVVMVLINYYRLAEAPKSMFICTDEATSCEDGEVRLEGGFSPSNGRVEFCQYRTWGAVCGEGWDDNDARVVCGQLGYSNPEGFHDTTL